jgi:hypothetical protein
MTVISKARQVRKPEFVRRVGDRAGIAGGLKPFPGDVPREISSAPQGDAAFSLGRNPEPRAIAIEKQKRVAFRPYELKPIGFAVENDDIGILGGYVLYEHGGRLDQECGGVAVEEPVVVTKLLKMPIDDVRLPEPISGTAGLLEDLLVQPAKLGVEAARRMREDSIDAAHAISSRLKQLLGAAELGVRIGDER